MKSLLSILLVFIIIGGCAPVKSFQREKLSDPVMAPQSQFSKQEIEYKFFSTREGSIGGANGIGGGCGCAK
jgi:hypothetical protein